jgi:hypothetical protein
MTNSKIIGVFFVSSLMLGLLTGPAGADTIYVGHGSNYLYRTIQEGINAAHDGDMVIVARGTYTGDGNRDIDFLGKAITVKGAGMPGSCVVDCEGDSSNQHRGFYFHKGEGRNAILDGFTITRGYLTTEYGGGIFCEGSSPAIINCIIKNNKAFGGGGMSVWSSANPKVMNCIFVDNFADEGDGDGDGGGMFNQDSSPEISNCLFIENIGGTGIGRFGSGGAIRNYNASPRVSHCTFTGNTSSYGGGINNSPGGTPSYIDCLIWGNQGRSYWGDEVYNNDHAIVTFSFCDIEGGWDGPNVINDGGSAVIDGGGNINADPLFVVGPSAWGDCYLSQVAAGQASNSPCVDSGSGPATSLGMDQLTTRTDGVADSGVVDMGYHYPISTLPSSFSYIFPPNGAANIPTDADLDWEDSAGATSYDVYFGTASPPPYHGTRKRSDYDLPSLNLSTTYHWRIVAKNAFGETEGVPWHFSTQVKYTLSVSATAGGTTEPSPGIHTYNEGTEVFITALPEARYRFSFWSGDASGDTNPINIMMDSDKSVAANFYRIIYAPLKFAGQTVLNRSLSQAEYINILSWQLNPDNVDIVAYRVYEVEGSSRVLLAERDAHTFEYRHRMVEKSKKYVYMLVAVNNENREGLPAYLTME